MYTALHVLSLAPLLGSTVGSVRLHRDVLVSALFEKELGGEDSSGERELCKAEPILPGAMSHIMKWTHQLLEQHRTVSVWLSWL